MDYLIRFNEMKTIDTYINEKFRLRDDTKLMNNEYTHHPATYEELVELLHTYVEKHGPGTKENPVDLNFIDITNIKNWGASVFSRVHYPGHDLYLDISRWDVSNVDNFYCFFYNSNRLCSVGDLSRWNTSNAVNFSCMFYGCDYLTDLGDLSNWKTGKCTTFTAMFNGCKHLESIGDISGWDTSNAKTFAEMFKGCESLKDIGNLDHWTTDDLRYTKQMFAWCKSLENIGELTYWNTENLSDIHEMFFNCEKLPTVGNLTHWDIENIPRGKREKKCNDVFMGCHAMHSFPLWWDFKNSTIKRNYHR